MNTDKKVFNKLFSIGKVELESQKYEFQKTYTALLTEFKNLESNSNALYKDAKDIFDKLSKLKPIASRQFDATSAFKKECLQIMMAMNSLGLKDSKEWTDVRDMLDKSDKIENKLDSGELFGLLR